MDLVRTADIPKGAVSYYLAGKSTPKNDRLYIIAKALDVNEAWLLGFDVPMARTDDQKKNDQLVQLVARLRSDEGFYNTVVTLSGLDDGQYQSIAQLIATLKK